MKELSKYQNVFSRAPKKEKVIPEIQKVEKSAKKSIRNRKKLKRKTTRGN